MIKGVHTMFYSSDAEATRKFIKEKLGFPHCDVGGGWLIFQCPEADMGIHPAEKTAKLGEGAPGEHSISFYCDNVEKTVADLKKKGVEFTHGIEDHGFGLVTFFKMPGGVNVMLYEPRYEKKF
ncbi:MAG TPA: VOC family protein [Planctomycetota bacterium]|nr:VOC family protein [Planctomycetota bacterium]